MWVLVMLLLFLSNCLCFYHGYVSFYQRVFIFVMVLMLIFVNSFVFISWSCQLCLICTCVLQYKPNESIALMDEGRMPCVVGNFIWWCRSFSKSQGNANKHLICFYELQLIGKCYFAISISRCQYSFIQCRRCHRLHYIVALDVDILKGVKLELAYMIMCILIHVVLCRFHIQLGK